MALHGVHGLLEMEITETWPPSITREPSATGLAHGGGESFLGEQRIAHELLLKLGIRISPRTVGKYFRANRPPGGSTGQRWATFVRNHAKAVVACDFFVAVTASFQALYVFLAMEVSSRRILHINVAAHPTAEWTTQQCREFLAFDHPYRFLVHDHDSIFSVKVDAAIRDCGVHVLRLQSMHPPPTHFASDWLELSAANAWIT